MAEPGEKQTACERWTDKIKARLANLPPGSDLSVRRGALLKLFSNRPRTGHGWDSFVLAANEALNDQLVPMDRMSIQTTADGVLCQWCTWMYGEKKEYHGCPFCYCARREFERGHTAPKLHEEPETPKRRKKAPPAAEVTP